MKRMPALADYARRVTAALRFIRDGIEYLTEELMKDCPTASPLSIAQAITLNAINGAFEID